jgi:hypothetical protein
MTSLSPFLPPSNQPRPLRNPFHTIMDEGCDLLLGLVDLLDPGIPVHDRTAREGLSINRSPHG